jgi:hypothetical protein
MLAQVGIQPAANWIPVRTLLLRIAGMTIEEEGMN